MAKKTYLDGKEVDRVCIEDYKVHHVAIVAEDERCLMWQWVKYGTSPLCLEFLTDG